MRLASVLSPKQLDDEDTRRLQDAIDELDAAVRTIRNFQIKATEIKMQTGTVFAGLEYDPGTPQST